MPSFSIILRETDIFKITMCKQQWDEKCQKFKNNLSLLKVTSILLFGLNNIYETIPKNPGYSLTECLEMLEYKILQLAW